MDECPRCGLPLISTDKAQMDQPLPVRTLIVRTLIVLLGILITAALFTFAGVRVYYWRDAKRLERDYVNHTIELITMDNGVQGHAISFFGKDGDSVYIEELGKSYQYIGGVARVEFADYIWFDSDPEDIESAELTISPVHISAAGRKTRLPAFTINVPVPEAPVTITSPTTDHVNVITSLATINMNVVYGSQVIINGEDVTSKVDRSGALSLNVNVYPIGDNNISIIVRTDHHKEARRDLVFFRDEMEINLELATSVGYTSTLNYMTIVGKTDPGAWIDVDSNYDPASLVIDQQTGEFSFKAKFSSYGDNIVSFRATMEGIDPVGACVGPRGGRVGAVVDELRGEKMDIVVWSEDPAQFVASALSPADVVAVTVLPGMAKACRVIVPDDQLSLAIGKEGQNARLAARLTGYKIDIKPASQADAEPEAEEEPAAE